MKISAWHIDPSTQNYNKMGKTWRPTKLQTSCKYPSIIDWIPFPSIRDKLVTYHAANPRLDDIIRAIGNSYVMEIDLSKLIANIPPTQGYVSVWDLVQAISPVTTNRAADSNEISHLWNCSVESSLPISDQSFMPQHDNGITRLDLPATDANSLFTSRSLALQSFELLGMNKGATFFRLDPAFFEEYPELYDHHEEIMARGVPLKSPYRESIPSPEPFDISVLEQYKQLSSWTVDLLVEGTILHTN